MKVDGARGGDGSSPPGRAGGSRPWLLIGCVLAVLAVATAAVLVGLGERGDVADSRTATVWVKSVVRRVDDRLGVDVDASDVRIRDDGRERRPQWLMVASEIQSTLKQSGDVDTAPLIVSGRVTYVAPVRRWNVARLRRETEFVSCAFAFTEECVPAAGGVRWWRLQRVPPSEGAPAETGAGSARR